MTKQLWISPRLVAVVGATCLCFLFLAAPAAHAATQAYWDFEDGTAGQSFTPAGEPNGSGGSVDTVNGILMRGWDPTYGPSWSNVTTARPESTLSMQLANNGQDGYVTEGALHNWAPTAWTIETAVYLEEMGGWESMIGRQGSSISEPAADFYLQNNGIDDRFRINFVTEGGQRWILDSDVVPEINRWYGLAVKSDGVTLSMWMDEGNGYSQVGTLDMSAQTPEQNALRSSTFDWTFGRSWYNGGNVDHIDGFMDDVRFSDVALATQDLIGINPAPAPLRIEVNKATGVVTLRNTGDNPITFDYYLIESAAGALNPTGWNSLSDQGLDAGNPADFDNSGGPVNGADLGVWKTAYGVNATADADGDGDSDGRDFLIWQREYGQTAGAGDSWDEAGGASTTKLAELFLNGASTINPGQSITLGTAYNKAIFGAGDGDLTFKYGVAGSGLLSGGVAYLSSLTAAVTVPEPAGFTLAAIALLAAFGRTSKR